MTDATRHALNITPDTKVGALLKAYPELEEVLLAYAPAFRKLTNPILRRTVARVATLRRAAGVAGKPVRDLVLTLRRAVGQAVDDVGEVGGDEDWAPPEQAPAWVTGAEVVEIFDADLLLEAGQSPMGPVLKRARGLAPGQVVRVDASFRPAPLLDKAREVGCSVFAQASSADRFALFVGSSAPSK